MRFGGVNLLAVLVAAIAIWAIGLLIYGVLFDKQWMAWTGTSMETAESEMWRMGFSPVMPILTALGLAVIYRWKGVSDLRRAMVTSLVLWLCFGFVILMYGWTYSDQRPEVLALDSVHILLNYLVGGAIIALWPKGRGRAVAAA